ncbi:MAG: hypothetical protein JHC93_01325 [Parachlamydiales bacterium]|nr:hypothetical protein [Parachlamydiales bacterium]
MIESIKSGNSTLEDKVFTHEHEFFNTLGRLAKDLNLNKSYPDRPFSSEMLLPIHALNKGFIALNQYTNEKVCQDLGELKNYGFQRLNYKFYLEMTQYWTYYDDHFQFHEQIDHSAQKLIRSTRLLRKEIYSITHDWRSAFRSDFTKLLKEPLGNFEKDWSDYTQSHKLLKEVNNIYIKSDYFDEYHRLRLRNYFIEDTFDKAVTALDKELPIHLKG